jgi:hypothetical protein
MKTKDFFRLVLKLFGLYSLVIWLFTILPNNLPFLFLSSGSGVDFDWLPIVWLVVVTSLLIILFFFLTFRPDFLIEKLKLDKGFDSDTINFQSLNAKNILNVGIILIGGLIVLLSLPPFLSSAYYAIKSAVATSEEIRMQSSLDNGDYIKLITNLLNIILGYLLLSNYQFISGFLLPKGSGDQA